MNEEQEVSASAGGIIPRLGQIEFGVRRQVVATQTLARDVNRITPLINQINDREARRIEPSTQRTEGRVLELERQRIPRLQNQSNTIGRNVNTNGRRTEGVQRLVERSMEENAECCKEITTQGDRNVTIIKNDFKLEINNQLNIVKKDVTVQFNNVNNNITRKSSVTNNLIGGVKTSLFNNFNSLRVNLRIQFGNTVNQIIINRSLIIEVSGVIQAHITTEIAFVLSAIGTAVAELTLQIEAVLAFLGTIETTIGGIVLQLGQLQVNLNVDLGGLAIQIRTAQYLINRNTNRKTNDVTISLSKEIYNLNTKLSTDLSEINKKIDTLSKRQDESFDKLPRRLGEVVSDYIIGESYYRWDATSTYFCTLVFKFKETDVNAYARVSQLKVRLKQRNEEITDSDIQDLRVRAISLENLTYTYGRTRAYYVSPDKRFKTSLFSDTREEANHVLNETLTYINDVFDIKNVSYTEKIERENKTSRKTPLDGLPINRYNYKQGIEQKLFKIVLIVNGISRPITIMQFKP